MVIYKYPVDLIFGEVQEIALPVGAVPLSAGEQRGSIVLWVMVDPEALETKCLAFVIMPTGYAEVPEGFDASDFLGTCQMPSGLVAHVLLKGGRNSVHS